MNQKVLISLMVIGMVGAVVGGSTLAAFNDQETSTGNAFAAGAIDLRIDWEETWNGEPVEVVGPLDNPGPIFDFDDLKPGDEGEATISLDLQTNPGWIWFRLTQVNDSDGHNPACTEPENLAEENCAEGNDGELDEHFSYVVWYDDGDNVFEENETRITTTTPGQEEVCNADISLTMDRSGSMIYDQYGGSTQQAWAELNATRLFINEAYAGGVTPFTGIVAFGGTNPNSEILENMTFNDQDLLDEVNMGIFVDPDNTGTDLQDGVETSADMLQDQGRAGVGDFMVVVTDGAQAGGLAGDPVAEATDAKNDGITVITVGVDAVDKPTLEAMASDDPDDGKYFYDVQSTGNLPSVFSDIRDEICNQIPAQEESTDLSGGVLLDGNMSEGGVQPYPAGTSYIGFKWNFSIDAGNEVQTDELVYDMDFYTEQARHNPSPQNPWD